MGGSFADYSAMTEDGKAFANVLHLMMDSHKAHLLESVKARAAELQIVLHFVPVGMTDECQPLDRAVFGALKRQPARRFREQISQNPLREGQIKVKKVDATRMLIWCWEVSLPTLLQAWAIYNVTR
jgi:hypothetical protein